MAKDRHLLDDFDVEALERGDVRRCIGEQADFVDARIGKDLAAEAYLAQDALAVSVIFVRAILSARGASRWKRMRCGSTVRSMSNPRLVLCR